MSGSFLKSRPSIFQRHRTNLRRSRVWVSCLFRLIYCCVLGLVFGREAAGSTWHRKPSPTRCSAEASPAKEDGSPSSASVYSMVLRNELFGTDVVGPASPATPEKATGVSSRDLTKSPLSPVRNLFRFKSDQYAPGSPYSDSPVGSEALFSPNVGTPPKPPRKITRSPYKFEDFANHNAFTLLEKYSSTHLVFNDDIQGTAAVVLSGLVASLKLTGGRLDDHMLLFLGAGEAGTGIAELIALEIAKQGKISLNEARKRIWLVDSKGLIVKSRVGSLQHFKKPWAHEHKPCKSLLDAVESIRPIVLIGTSGAGKTFTKEVIETFSSFNEKPLILALSNPTSQSECTAEEAYSWSKGRAIFASGSPFDPVAYDGKTFTPGQSNNAYIFPGLGLGLVMSGTIHVHDDMLLEASEALAQQVTKEHLDQGLIYPPFQNIRKISAHIAVEVAAKSYELGK